MTCTILPALLCFVCSDCLRPSQQSFSHIGTDLPVLNQYKAEDKVAC